jgi:hypothetical protein
MNDIAPLSVTRFIIFTKRIITSDVFHYFYETRYCQWRVCFLYIQTRSASPSHLRGVWTKCATDSGAFHYFYETRH